MNLSRYPRSCCTRFPKASPVARSALVLADQAYVRLPTVLVEAWYFYDLSSVAIDALYW